MIFVAIPPQLCREGSPGSTSSTEAQRRNPRLRKRIPGLVTIGFFPTLWEGILPIYGWFEALGKVGVGTLGSLGLGQGSGSDEP